MRIKKTIIESETFKCPNCGSKVLKNTGYCLSCKKKVAEPEKDKAKDKKESSSKKNILIIKQEVALEQKGKRIILEKGDRVKVLSPMDEKGITKDDVVAYMVKGGDNEKNAQESVDMYFNDVVRIYRGQWLSVKKIAEIIRSFNM